MFKSFFRYISAMMDNFHTRHIGNLGNATGSKAEVCILKIQEKLRIKSCELLQNISAE